MPRSPRSPRRRNGAGAITSSRPTSASSPSNSSPHTAFRRSRSTDTAPFWTHIISQSGDYETDVLLADGDDDRCGQAGRSASSTARATRRPTRSSSTTPRTRRSSATISSRRSRRARRRRPPTCRRGGRRRALYDYLSGLRLTAAMSLQTTLGGHGPVIADPAGLIDGAASPFHSARLDRIEQIVAGGATTAFEIARELWSDEVARTQTVLAIWEVLGHLDILVAARGAARAHRSGSSFLPSNGGDPECNSQLTSRRSPRRRTTGSISPDASR